VNREVNALTDLVFGAVKASSRKGELLTNQQIIDLVGSRDLKDLLNRVKDRYPFLATVSPSLSVIEEALLKSYKDEVREFIKIAPELTPVLRMALREVEEVEVTSALKAQLGISTPESAEVQRKVSKEEVLGKITSKGFATEVKNATEIYEKYKVPGLIDAVFARQRLLNLVSEDMGIAKDISEELRDYTRLKIDVFNIDILLRGIKNGIERKALAEVVIYDGSLSEKLLQEALTQTDVKKVLSLIESAGLPKVDSPRALERYYESKISKLMSRTYYNGYLGAGAIMGYLELKYREIRNIIRIANAISLGIDPKRLAQDFIF
jgi:vacuolar-type H+-ATPase subunit C/Vma6